MTTSKIKCVDQVVTDQYAIYLGDSCEVIRAIPGDTIHYSVHSPPFIGLYKFSNYDRDLSNSDGEMFWEHYAFLIKEMLRVTMPGRLASVHCMQLPRNKGRDGFIGIRDFRGEIIRLWQDCGWNFHSEVCINKDPVGAMQRTKSQRLLHKQILKDSAVSGQATADYVVTFHKPGVNPEAISGGFTQWVGDGSVDISREAYDRDVAGFAKDGRKPWPYDAWVSIMCWQRYAAPVWSDIRQHRVLTYQAGRDEKDIAHISPLQLDVIERCIELWSAKGDTVLTPFLGVGSEVYGAIHMGRRGIGIELKPSYFNQAVRNLQKADSGTLEQDMMAPVNVDHDG
jgi:hypothetical protein